MHIVAKKLSAHPNRMTGKLYRCSSISLPVKAKSPSYSFPSCHFTRHLPSLMLPSTILETRTIAVPSSAKSRRACEAVGFGPEKKTNIQSTVALKSLIKLTCGAFQSPSYGATSQHFTSLRATHGSIKVSLSKWLTSSRDKNYHNYYLTHN